jgi:hypothetical protein
VVSESDPLKLSSNIKDWGLRYSPYGAWSVQVENKLSELRLDTVTAVRFEFHLDFFSKSGHGSSVFFNETGCRGELKGSACTMDAAAGPGRSPSPPPPLSPPPSPPPSPSGCDSCSTFPQFNTCIGLVTKSCCDEPSEKCVNGQPATCNSGCGRVLKPMISKCKQVLAKPYMLTTKAALEKAASKCPASFKPCTNFGQMDSYSKAVNSACCSKPGSCTGGIPKACTGHCAGALVPMSSACTPFLKSKPYFGATLKSLQAAVKSCTGGGH